VHVLRALHREHERPLSQLRWRIAAATPAKDVNYRHAFHAGNFADVVKHVTLVGILLHLRKKEKPFRVIDTHAGRGRYDIANDEALRTGEAVEGIARLRDFAPDAAMPSALSTYLKIVRDEGEAQYPGSPLIIARLLRKQDHLVALERHPDEAALLDKILVGFPDTKSACADGYARLASLLPPPERRGLVLIDPPYEAKDEFTRVAEAVAIVRKRFATGIVLIWYPIKSPAPSDAFAGEILSGGTQEILRITIDVGGDPSRLAAAGLLVINPPFGLADEMQGALAVLAPLLGRKGCADFVVEAL